MFGLINNAYKSMKKKQQKPITIVLLGVDNAGKSTLLHSLKTASTRSHRKGRRRFLGTGAAEVAVEQDEYTPAPTIGFDESSLEVGGQAYTLYDLGGSRGGRTLWSSYVDEVHGVIFVVDAADPARLDEVREVLHESMANDHVRGKPVLILCNKQDLPGALAPAAVAERLGLHELKECPHQLEACIARRADDGRTIKGFKWLASAVRSDYPRLQARVERDMAEKKQRAEVERAERKKRIEERRAKREAEREAAERAAAEEAPTTTAPSGSGPLGGAPSLLAPAQVEMMAVGAQIGGESAPRPVSTSQVAVAPSTAPAVAPPGPPSGVAVPGDCGAPSASAVGASAAVTPPPSGMAAATPLTTPSAISVKEGAGAPGDQLPAPAAPGSAGSHPPKRLPSLEIPPAVPQTT
mmetsp:Transcript_5126/g.14953  ORF Transcript_5126/g.14953 Transcript_5126/m.14953 type:complete len:409 (-) Transcript_5126:146-1372(-)